MTMSAICLMDTRAQELIGEREHIVNSELVDFLVSRYIRTHIYITPNRDTI